MKQILSGKTLNEETLAYARSLDLNVQCIDFIEIEPLPFEIENYDFDSIAFTSSNAVKFFAKTIENKELLKTRKIFSLSGKTANALLKLGIQPALTANTADLLAGKIIESKSKSVLHPCGNLKLDSLENKLKVAHIIYSPILVYKTILNKEIKLNKTFDAILFFSPSGVESFFCENKWSTATIACCIGETTAETLRKKEQGAGIVVPKLPTPESMLKTTATYLKKHSTAA